MPLMQLIYGVHCRVGRFQGLQILWNIIFLQTIIYKNRFYMAHNHTLIFDQSAKIVGQGEGTNLVMSSFEKSLAS